VFPRSFRGRGPPPVASMTNRVRFVTRLPWARPSRGDARTANAAAEPATKRRRESMGGILSSRVPYQRPLYRVSGGDLDDSISRTVWSKRFTLIGFGW